MFMKKEIVPYHRLILKLDQRLLHILLVQGHNQPEFSLLLISP